MNERINQMSIEDKIRRFQVVQGEVKFAAQLKGMTLSRYVETHREDPTVVKYLALRLVVNSITGAVKMKQTLYLVIADKFDSYHGVELYCAGVFSAKEAAEELAKQYEDAEVKEIELNSDAKEVYLGGYRE